jgi:CheY-like chemotaxis protein
MASLSFYGASAFVPVLFSDRKSFSPEFLTDVERATSGSEDKKKSIFVIDDEVLIADSLVEILNDFGYHAHAFYDGRVAIDFAKQKCPDIVLSDVLMPKLNGIDTVTRIRELCPDTHIILFSGQAGTVNLLEQARAKGQEFELLPKPIHPEDLLQRLSELR